jgi:acyl dehydratase
MTTRLDGVDRWDGESYGTYGVTEAEIREFAERYDPQPIHTDPERATASMYGDLIASGWHTAAMSMRLLVDGFLSETAVLGAKGLDRLRWPEPVYAGDELTVYSTIHGVEAEREAYGVVRWGIETTASGADEERTVLAAEALVLVEK